jgi:hypothetical protein
LVWFAATVGLWGATAWEGHRLLTAFVARQPRIAEMESPEAMIRGRHPRKALFFYTNRAAELLQDDPVLCRLRKRFVALSVLSVIVPLAGFAVFFIYAVLHSDKASLPL